jgi:hypothetical protein
MKGLLLKEIYVMFKNNKISLIVIPLFSLFGIFNKQFMFIMLIPVLLSMLTLGTMTYDELSRWNSFAQCMPVERKSIVSSKYITMVLMALTGSVIVGTVHIIQSMIQNTVDIRSTALMALASFALALVVPCLSIPLNFKFGTTNGRIFYLIIAGVICGVVPAMVMSDSKKFTAKAMKLFSNFPAFFALSIVVIIAVIAVSWLVSIRIYERKEL